MAVSCPEVMYGAYYPYLYGRGGPRSFHHAPHFQYDRLNVQQSGGNVCGETYAGGLGGAAASSGSSASPRGSPGHARLRTKEEDLSQSRHSEPSSESEGECAAGPRARAQYVSANCVVFTHYSGDVAAVVDEHFARALAQDKHKESVPMVSRNLPASFFNALAAPGGGGAGACGVDIYEYDPWAQHYGGYGGAQYHGAHVSYGGLLLGRPPLHHQYKDWPHQHAAHLDPGACSPYYPPVPGLEAPVQDTSKDLYWF